MARFREKSFGRIVKAAALVAAAALVLAAALPSCAGAPARGSATASGAASAAAGTAAEGAKAKGPAGAGGRDEKAPAPSPAPASVAAPAPAKPAAKDSGVMKEAPVESEKAAGVRAASADEAPAPSFALSEDRSSPARAAAEVGEKNTFGMIIKKI